MLTVAPLTLPCLPPFLFTAWGLYSLLSSVMDGPAVLLVGLLGMKLSPHFDKVRCRLTVRAVGAALPRQ